MDLREQINNIQIIDHHCHAFDYVHWQEAVGRYPFEEFTAKLPLPAPMSPLARTNNLMRAYREIYDFPYATLTAENQKELDDLYQRSKKNEIEVYNRVMEKAKIESAVEICQSHPELPPQLDPRRFKIAQLVDGLILPLDNTELKKASTERASTFLLMCEAYLKYLRRRFNAVTFKDYVKLVNSALEDLHKQGCAALKMNYVYWRDIAIDAVDEDEARQVFESKDVRPSRYKRLQDFLLRLIISKAAELDMPVQIHTGTLSILRPIGETDPIHLDPFLWLPDIRKAKIVFLHGAYPFCRESGFMTGRAGISPRIYLDISAIWWLHYGSPLALVGILRNWLEMGIAEKMLFGSDSIDPLTLWLSCITVREGLYLALKGLVDDGFVSESQALSMARMVLRDNAKKLYNM